MKTLRFFGVCLLASLLCVNFSACGGEDTPEPENPGNNPSNPTVGPGNGVSSNEKRLVKMEFIEDDRTETFSFEYDEQGRVITAIEEEQDDSYGFSIDINRLTWKGNTLIYNEDGDDDNIVFTLKNGRIVSDRYDYEDEDNSTKYEYDNDKRLVKIVDKEATTTFSWTYGKIVKWSKNYNSPYDEDYYKEIIYSNQTCKGFFPEFGSLAEDDYIFNRAQPELFGLKSNYLPSSIIRKDNDETTKYDYTYTFDEEGYIKSYTEETTYSSSYGTSYGTEQCILTWE